MPTEARGNYLPEPPYLRETKTITASHSSRVDTTCWQLFRPAIDTVHFYFLLQKLCQVELSVGLKKLSLLPEAPTTRPEARGICHICHVVDPALCSATRLR